MRGDVLLLAMSRSANSTRDKLMGAGFDEVISKPASLAGVLIAVRKAAPSTLERARRHVASAEGRVVDQQVRIDALRRNKHDTTDAEELLWTLEAVLAAMREHLALEESEKRQANSSPN